MGYSRIRHLKRCLETDIDYSITVLYMKFKRVIQLILVLYRCIIMGPYRFKVRNASYNFLMTLTKFNVYTSVLI